MRLSAANVDIFSLIGKPSNMDSANELLIHGFETVAGSTQNEAQNTDTFKRAYVGSGSGTSCPTTHAGVNSASSAVWLDNADSGGGSCAVLLVIILT